MAGIPRVRCFRITLKDSGLLSRRIHHVTAPTRRLAVLNLRLDPSYGIWGPIATVGNCRGKNCPNGGS